MGENVSVKELLRQVKFSDFVTACPMPMGYSEGYPILEKKNGQLCMTIPFLRYQVTGQVDKTLVFPIRYAVTVTLPQLRPVAFRDLSVESAFREIDFDKPIGYFRHEAIRDLSRQEYQQKQDRLYSLYAAVIQGKANQEQTEEMAGLLQLLAEPCQIPIYRELCPEFCQQFLA